MEYGSIERELHVEAAPEMVYDVLSSPEHIREWWGADSEFEAVAGGAGELVWGDPGTPEAQAVPFSVVEADRPRRFAFRWAPDATIPDKWLLVTFELAPAGEGTTLRLTESGFREMGWEAAVLEAHYLDHVRGWTQHLGDLQAYAARLVRP